MKCKGCAKNRGAKNRGAKIKGARKFKGIRYVHPWGKMNELVSLCGDWEPSAKFSYLGGTCNTPGTMV